ncbi:isocitrate/isopropylmalate family dehydrogenase [Lachnospiraceae bacterium 62-35]
MSYTVSIIEGDGIGHEIVPAALQVLEHTGVPFQWEFVPAGEKAVEKYQTPVPDITTDSIQKNKLALKGPLTNLVGKGWPSPNVLLRKKLGLYAAVKRARYFEGVGSPFKDADFLVVREAKEDTYAGAEQQVGPDAAVAIKYITRDNSKNVARFTFDLARRMGRKKVTITHKANVLKLTDGLFLKSAQEIAAEFPDIECESLMIDHLAFKLVKEPLTCDVILALNVYGDILADLIAGICGSLGLGFGGNFGPDAALFEPVHGTAPTIAGQGIANPIGEILSGAMLLDYIGEHKAAALVETAVASVLKKGKCLTADLGGTAKTSDITKAIMDEMDLYKNK